MGPSVVMWEGLTVWRQEFSLGFLFYTAPKINIEPENDGWEDDFPLPGVSCQVPCWSSRGYHSIETNDQLMEMHGLGPGGLGFDESGYPGPVTIRFHQEIPTKMPTTPQGPKPPINYLLKNDEFWLAIPLGNGPYHPGKIDPNAQNHPETRHAMQTGWRLRSIPWIYIWDHLPKCLFLLMAWVSRLDLAVVTRFP